MAHVYDVAIGSFKEYIHGKKTFAAAGEDTQYALGQFPKANWSFSVVGVNVDGAPVALGATTFTATLIGSLDGLIWKDIFSKTEADNGKLFFSTDAGPVFFVECTLDAVSLDGSVTGIRVDFLGTP